MERLISKNPNRTEENKDLFDFAAGHFIVETESHTKYFFYTGNNMYESAENWEKAKRNAEKYAQAFKPMGIRVHIIEKEAHNPAFAYNVKYGMEVS